MLDYSRINRIRLEFKVNTSRAVKLSELGINRIKLEFKESAEDMNKVNLFVKTLFLKK